VSYPVGGAPAVGGAPTTCAEEGASGRTAETTARATTAKPDCKFQVRVTKAITFSRVRPTIPSSPR
jgi:hypothetical protein